MQQAAQGAARRAGRHFRLPLRSLLCAMLAAAGMARAESLEPAVEKKVRAATFEVVVPKPVDDPVSYEKPLPLDLLPYQFRMDKYYSIGTAFALGQHRYATAAHVLLAAVGSQLGAPALRDAAGHVFAVRQILKFSSGEDFVVFSLADEPDVTPLETGPAPAVNDTVYAVGNALGDGIVIRDGLYTSDTPEEIDGRWKWLRFSAAASPGNSGGPLLDKGGRVVGIVRAKSPNENLNYGLPIGRVLEAKDNIATLDTRARYQLDIFNEKQTGRLAESFPLPKDFAEFSAAYLRIWDTFNDQLLADLLRNNADSIFPQGEQSVNVLHRIENQTFPQMIIKADDGNWDVFQPKDIKGADLPHNGYISHGNLNNDTMIHLHRPEGVPAKTFYGDPRTYMDMVLKGVNVSRAVGSDNIRVVSLGNATEDSVFVDPYGRKWQLRVWPMAYRDSFMISMALPVPDGYIGFLRIGSPRLVHSHIADMKALTGFISAIYDGSLEQWRDFLANRQMLPAAFSDMTLDFDYGHGFHFKSNRFAISYDSDLQPVVGTNDLMLDFSFFKDHGKTVWDVAGIEVDESKESSTGLAIFRNQRPAESMDDSSKSWWSKIEGRKHPFDSIAYDDNDKMFIRSVPLAAGGDKPDFLYNTVYEIEGPASQDVMKDKLERIAKGLSVTEH